MEEADKTAAKYNTGMSPASALATIGNPTDRCASRKQKRIQNVKPADTRNSIGSATYKHHADRQGAEGVRCDERGQAEDRLSQDEGRRRDERAGANPEAPNF